MRTPKPPRTRRMPGHMSECLDDGLHTGHMTYPVQTPRTLPERTTGAPTLLGAGMTMGIWVAVLWALEAIDAVLPGLGLDYWGISPRDLGELPQIFTAPFLHFGFEHLLANTVPLFVLGVIILMSGLRVFVVATLSSIVVSGATIWLLAPPNSVTAGASGLVFGWLAFVIVRGIFTANWKHLLVGVAVFAVYGGVLWGVLPSGEAISWQAHLGGAAGGVLAAWWLSGRRTSTRALPR